MKKFLILSILTAFALAGCKEKEPAVYTLLGDYTPYGSYMETLKGRVASVVETNFWAVPEGETYAKGNKMTMKELDSLNYTGDFEAIFDDAGDLVSCTGMDENKKAIWKWELIKENNILAEAYYTYLDTARGHQELECNTEGDIIKISQFPADADTLFNWASVTSTPGGDTVITQWHNYKGEPARRTLNLYNELDLFTGYEAYDKDGNYLNGSQLKYNDRGVSSEITFFNKDKEPASVNHFTYEYDKMGNWIKIVCKDDKGFVIIGERVYTYFE